MFEFGRCERTNVKDAFATRKLQRLELALLVHNDDPVWLSNVTIPSLGLPHSQLPTRSRPDLSLYGHLLGQTGARHARRVTIYRSKLYFLWRAKLQRHRFLGRPRHFPHSRRLNPRRINQTNYFRQLQRKSFPLVARSGRFGATKLQHRQELDGPGLTDYGSGLYTVGRVQVYQKRNWRLHMHA